MALLHEDLLQIRNKATLSAAEIHANTRIPISTITEIEKGLIFDNPEHQSTYIRSFVRSYAKAIGIKDDDIIAALDAQENKRYKGQLAIKYLGLSPTEAGFDEISDSSELQALQHDGPGASIVKPGPTSTIGGEEYSRPDPSRDYNKVTPPPPEITNVDWAGLGTRFTGFSGGPALLGGIILIIIVLAGGIYYFTQSGSEDPQSTTTTAQGSSVETSASETESETESEASSEVMEIQPVPVPEAVAESPSVSLPGITLPDTLFVVVHAALDKLEPVRILSDINNTTFPYWIENSQAMRFDFVNQIAIRGQLSRMAIYINGHYVDDFLDYDIGDRTIRITRQMVREHPTWFTQPPAPLPPSVSPPTVIRERPVF